MKTAFYFLLANFVLAFLQTNADSTTTNGNPSTTDGTPTPTTTDGNPTTTDGNPTTTDGNPTTTDGMTTEIGETTTDQTEEKVKDCQAVCSGFSSKYEDLKIYANITNRILVVANVTQWVSIVLDLKNNIFGLWNGRTGCADVADIPRNRGLVVCPKDSPLLGSDTIYNNPHPIETQLQKISSLEDLFDRKLVPTGTQYSLDNPPKESMEIGNFIVEHLVGGPIPGIKEDPIAGLKIIKLLAQQIYDVMNGSLRDILPILKGKIVNGNLLAFTEVLRSMELIFNKEFTQ